MKLQDLVTVAQQAIEAKNDRLVTKADLKVALTAVFETIKEISAVEDVTIHNFGTFTRQEVEEREVQTVFTANLPGGVAKVEAHIRPKFVPATHYRTSLRYGRSVAA